MSFRDIYIGYLDDTSFDWNGGNFSIGNIPNRQSPLFPYPVLFFELIQKIGRGELEGKQLDWGAWGAKVDKKYIKDFINESYGDDWFSRHPEHELVDFVEGLDPAKIYLLIACEL